MRLWLRGLAAAIAVVVLDQLSKGAVLRFFHAAGCANDRKPVTPFFNLVLTCNRGMSFGLFNRAGADEATFILGAVVIVAALIYWLRRVARPMLAAAISLVIGGAIGNVVDRLRYHGVVDFLDFHIGLWHWPAFNLADSAISIGIVIMLFDGLLLHREAH